MKSHSTAYIFGFSALVCLVCSVFVSGSAVLLRPLQEENRILDRQSKVLTVAGLMRESETLEPAEIQKRFKDNIIARVVDLSSGAYVDGVDVAAFDQQKVMKDPATSSEAPDNAAKVARLPKQALVYQVQDRGKVTKLILPIEGKGLWSTLYGYIALSDDVNTIEGITFYKHGETPGLGGEVDNPSWKARWKGRKAFDAAGEVKIAVIKGAAKGPAEDPYKVDGLSGATITARGVSATVRFWLSDDAFGPYLGEFRKKGS